MEKKKRFGRKVLCLSLLAVLTACSENESSIGNRQTIHFSDTLAIKALSADTLTVEKGSLTLTYTRTGQETNK